MNEHDPWDDPPKVLVSLLLTTSWDHRRGDRIETPLLRCAECGRQHIPQSGRWCPCGAALPFEVYRVAS